MAILALLVACKLVQIKVTWQYTIYQKLQKENPLLKPFLRENPMYGKVVYTHQTKALPPNGAKTLKIVTSVCVGEGVGEEGTLGGTLNSL